MKVVSIKIKILVFILICLLSFDVNAQAQLQEVVYLKNGSIIKGIIVEQDYLFFFCISVLIFKRLVFKTTIQFIPN